jgi:hypothetical protein
LRHARPVVEQLAHGGQDDIHLNAIHAVGDVPSAPFRRQADLAAGAAGKIDAKDSLRWRSGP